MRNWIFVKVETDQAGLYGWGEATLEWKTKSVVGAVEDLAVLLIGQDPRRIEHLWQVMHRPTRLSMSSAPPWLRGITWSATRLGCPHPAVAQMGCRSMHSARSRRHSCVR